MTKAVVLTQGDWAKIYNQIAQDYPPSVLLIRDKMKSVLGFTSRTHTEWVFEDFGHPNQVPYTTIHLDFYNEPKRTMFLLRYGDFIREKPSYSGYTEIE